MYQEEWVNLVPSSRFSSLAACRWLLLLWLLPILAIYGYSVDALGSLTSTFRYSTWFRLVANMHHSRRTPLAASQLHAYALRIRGRSETKRRAAFTLEDHIRNRDSGSEVIWQVRGDPDMFPWRSWVSCSSRIGCDICFETRLPAVV